MGHGRQGKDVGTVWRLQLTGATLPPPCLSPAYSDPVFFVQTACPGCLVRALRTFDKGRHAAIELVEGVLPFRFESQRDHRAMLIRPLSPLDR